METFVVWFENSALGRRMVGKTHSRARQEYTLRPEQAMVFHRLDDAKAFARNWCHRTGCRFTVYSNLDQKLKFEVKQCG